MRICIYVWFYIMNIWRYVSAQNCNELLPLPVGTSFWVVLSSKLLITEVKIRNKAERKIESSYENKKALIPFYHIKDFLTGNECKKGVLIDFLSKIFVIIKRTSGFFILMWRNTGVFFISDVFFFNSASVFSTQLQLLHELSFVAYVLLN